jgi:LPS sulfotransferase NodH
MLYPSEQVKKFVILFQGRSGSTYLTEALRSHSKIRAQGEQLVGRKEQGFVAQAQWIREFFKPRPLAPYAAIGFKTKLSDVVDAGEFANLLKSLDVNIIHLERHNMVKQTISWLNSERLYEATGDWNLYKEADRLPHLEVDLEKFADSLSLLEQGKRWLRRYVDKLALPTLRLSYEDLLLDFEGTIERVLDFLEVPLESVESRVKKSTNDDLRQAVSNFEELRAQYVGTTYEQMFDEVLGSSIVKLDPKRIKKMNYTKFVIVSQERSGSVLLELLLASHGHVLSFGEIFNPVEARRRESRKKAKPVELDDDPIEYLEDHIYKEYADNINAVGFRLFYTHARNNAWKAVWEYLRTSNVRIVHLKRKNLLDRYLSHQLALRSNKWIAYQGEDDTPYQPITLDPADCFKDFHRSLWYQKEIDEFFKDNPKLEVIYEDLCDDIATECKRVQEFLGLEFQALSTKTRKQLTQTKSEVIANYGDLKEMLTVWVSEGWAREEWIDFFDEEGI